MDKYIEILLLDFACMSGCYYDAHCVPINECVCFTFTCPNKKKYQTKSVQTLSQLLINI